MLDLKILGLFAILPVLIGLSFVTLAFLILFLAHAFISRIRILVLLLLNNFFFVGRLRGLSWLNDVINWLFRLIFSLRKFGKSGCLQTIFLRLLFGC